MNTEIEQRDRLGRITRKRDIQAALSAETAIKGSKLSAEDWARIQARHQLDCDLERFSDYVSVYSLTEDQRDRLIAHARQDAAHALLQAIVLTNVVKSTRRWIIAVGCATIALLIFIAFKLN